MERADAGVRRESDAVPAAAFESELRPLTVLLADWSAWIDEARRGARSPRAKAAS
jgi:hypothetical protein